MGPQQLGVLLGQLMGCAQVAQPGLIGLLQSVAAGADHRLRWLPVATHSNVDIEHDRHFLFLSSSDSGTS